MFSSKLSGFGNRTLLVAVVAALAVVGVAGYLAGVPGDVPVAHALCGGAYNCAGGDLTATSALTVAHAKQIDPYTLQPVEPNDGDTWAITARWSTDTGAACPCADIAFAAVAADVTWSDASGWSVSCTGCAPTTGPIRSVSICPVDG